MIITLIVFLILVVFMAFFIGLNVEHSCSLWLIKSFESLPVSVLVLLLFAAGIVFSLLLLIIYKLRQSSTENEVEKLAVEKSKNDKKNIKLREKTERKISKLQKKNFREKKAGLSDQNGNQTVIAGQVSPLSSTDSSSTDK